MQQIDCQPLNLKRMSTLSGEATVPFSGLLPFSTLKEKYSCILGVIILLCNNPVTPLIRAPDVGVLRIIQRYFFLFLNENICCDPSLEPSQ